MRATIAAGVWLLHDLPRSMSHLRTVPTLVAVMLVLLTPLTPQPIFLTGAIVVTLLAAKIVTTPQPER